MRVEPIVFSEAVEDHIKLLSRAFYMFHIVD